MKENQTCVRAVGPTPLNRQPEGCGVLWAELRPVCPPITHPIPKLTVPPIPKAPGVLDRALANARRLLRNSDSSQVAQVGLIRLHPRSRAGSAVAALATLAALAGTGCQMLTYTSPQGERFYRGSLGATTSISSLSIESDTTGLRRMQLQGYQNDSTQALGTVTEAAVRAALQGGQ